MKKLLPLIAFSLLVSAPVASALTQAQVRECQALAQSLGPDKAALEAKVAERDALAAEAEATGEAWENAEAVRNFDAENAAAADALRLSFHEKKTAFENAETDLFGLSHRLDKDTARFNSLCVTE